MNRPAATTHEPPPDIAKEELGFRRIVSKLRNAVRIEIPAGYEDETGFHMGISPAEKEIKPPFTMKS
jgi:hypothetical protein